MPDTKVRGVSRASNGREDKNAAPRKTKPPLRFTPAAMDEGDAAAHIAVSKQQLRKFVAERKILPVRVPGIRRKVYLTSDLLELVERWKAESDSADPFPFRRKDAEAC